MLAETKKLQSPITTAESVFNRAICENNSSLVQLTRLVTNLLRSHLFLLADGGVLPVDEEKLNPLDWGGTRCKWPPDPGVAELAAEMAEVREERARSTTVLSAMSEKLSSFSGEVVSQAQTFTEDHVQEALVGIEQSLENARGATDGIETRIRLSEAKLREDVATDIDAIAIVSPISPKTSILTPLRLVSSSAPLVPRRKFRCKTSSTNGTLFGTKRRLCLLSLTSA
jgi:hypothetical protein